MPKPSPSADQAVKGRSRGAFASAGPQSSNKPQPGGERPADPPYDIAIESFDCDTVPLFCKKNRISVAFYYKLKLQKKTPREMHLGNKRLISKESAEQWRKDREAEAAKKATV